MANDLNLTILEGRLVRSPSNIRYTKQDKTPILDFTIANNRFKGVTQDTDTLYISR